MASPSPVGDGSVRQVDVSETEKEVKVAAERPGTEQNDAEEPNLQVALMICEVK